MIDSSGSMTTNDRNGVRKTVTNEFIDKLAATDRAAIIDFDSYATLFAAFTSDKASLKSAVNRIDDNGGTNLTSGISMAIGCFTAAEYVNNNALKVIVMLTDGEGPYNTALTQQAADHNIIIYTVGLGSSIDTNLLKAMAEGTTGNYYHASDADKLYNIFDKIAQESDFGKDSDSDGINDYFEKEMNAGRLRLGTGVSLLGLEYLKADTDGDGLKDGNEITVVKNGSRIYVKMSSNPTQKDSDSDGYWDRIDPNPLKWNISDRDLAMLSSMIYSIIPEKIDLDNLSRVLENEMNERFMGAAHVDELNGFRVVDTWYARGGLQIAAFEKDDNTIVVFRGTEPPDGDGWELFADWSNNLSTFVLGISTQTPASKKFMKKTMENNKGNNFYVAGHSLGGHLAYNAAAEGIHYDASAMKGVVTFNGLGLMLGLTLVGDVWDEQQLLKKPSIIRNHQVEEDPVSRGILGAITWHYGTTTTYIKSEKAPNEHSLYTFLDKLEPFNRAKAN